MPDAFQATVLTDEAAKEYLAARHADSKPWLSSATECYVYDGGTWGGEVWYWCSSHNSNADCFEAMHASRY